MARAKKAVVVGAGIGGLSAASLLAHSGWEVDLLEKNEQVGGRARLWEQDGFRFDMGPSWYLMPEVFEEFFRLFGKSRESFYALHPLDPYYQVFFGPGESVRIGPDRRKTLAVFEGFEPGGAKRLEEYLRKAEYKYDVAMREFLYRDYASVFDFFNRRLIVEGLRLKVLSRLDRYVRRFFTDRRARQILEYAMVFLGTSPTAAPALYSIMSHVDLNLGVTYPEGGLAGVGRAMKELAESEGVRVLTDHQVTGISVSDGRAECVSTSRGSFDADVVLVNADYAHAELELLDPRYRSLSARYWSGRVMAPSMFILYLGVNRRLGGMDHHNLYFSEHWERHFDTIFRRPAWPDNPSFYMSCISKTDPGSAPPGQENVFILVPVAPGLDDTDEVRERYADQVIDHVERMTGESLRGSIAVQRIYSHRDFMDDYHAYRGTALALAHTLMQTAVFRPGCRSRKVGNLFYTGHYTHPGVGVPMVVIAAQVAAGVINEAAATGGV